MSEERTQQNTDAEATSAVRRQEAGGQEPDVLLDVSDLEVDRITLEVESLRAHVSLLAELANLLHLSVGVDARLEQVKLEIEGVEAKVLLKVRLEHVRAILEKALDTIAERPEILRILARSTSELVRERLGEAFGTLDDALEGLEVGDTVDEALKERLEGTRATLEEILERQQRGGVSTEGVVGEVEGAQNNEVQATPAAKRQAEELGVDLSRVEGTGAGGRITVRDVHSAAQKQ